MLAIAATVMCGPAAAEPILTATEVFGPNALDSGFPLTLVLPQYDGLSGPLIGVELTIYGIEQTQFRAMNYAPSDGTVTAAQAQSTLTLQYLGNNVVITTPTAYLTGGPYIVPALTYAPMNLGSVVTGEDTDFEIFDSSSDLVQAFRDGPVTFTLKSSTGTTGSSTGGDIYLGHSSSAEGWVVVRYITEVPEPATMVLIGSSLFGLALIGRKRFA